MTIQTSDVLIKWLDKLGSSTVNWFQECIHIPVSVSAHIVWGPLQSAKPLESV
jgi:hypothetical protein